MSETFTCETFKCGHPKTLENSKPRGPGRGVRCRECYNTMALLWGKSKKAREHKRLWSTTERARNGRKHWRKTTEKGRQYVRIHSQKQVASGASARFARAYLARKKLYLAEVFKETPEKRIPVSARTLVVLSDIQIPFEDPAAVNQALEVISHVRPDTVVLNGDIVDCYEQSVFVKDLALAAAATPESHRRTRLLMKCLQGVPNKIWLGGNHEARWKKLLWAGVRSPVTDNLLAFSKANGHEIDLADPVESFRRIYDMADYGFLYYPWGHRLYFAEGNLVVTHGKYVSRHSSYSAKRTFEWLGRSCIVGHTHRQGTYRVTLDGVEYGAWENGCLCLLDPEYTDTPNWQQGFSVVKINGPEFHVVQVPIIRRKGKPVAVYAGLEAGK